MAINTIAQVSTLHESAAAHGPTWNPTCTTIGEPAACGAADGESASMGVSPSSPAPPPLPGCASGTGPLPLLTIAPEPW